LSFRVSVRKIRPRYLVFTGTVSSGTGGTESTCFSSSNGVVALLMVSITPPSVEKAEPTKWMTNKKGIIAKRYFLNIGVLIGSLSAKILSLFETASCMNPVHGIACNSLVTDG
jgi:hypothetical protein